MTPVTDTQPLIDLDEIAELDGQFGRAPRHQPTRHPGISADPTGIDSAGASSAVRCVLRQYEHPPRLIVLGEIDTATADRFAHALERAETYAHAHGGRWVLDLTGLDFFGPIGTGILEHHHHAITAILVTRSSTAHTALSHSQLRTRLVYQPRHRPEQKSARRHQRAFATS